MFGDEAVKLCVRLQRGTGLDFVLHERLERLLPKYLAREADAGAELFPVIGMRHVVKADFWRLRRVSRPQRDVTPRLGPHRPGVGLKSMPFGRCLPVVAHRNWQKMVLNVWIVHAGLRADEGGGFKLVRRPHTGLCKQPLCPDHRLGQQIPVLIERDWLA